MSAHALGAMVKGMGGQKFDELMNWLMETLKSEGSSVDRSGAAQGKYCKLFGPDLNRSNFTQNVHHNETWHMKDLGQRSKISTIFCVLSISGLIKNFTRYEITSYKLLK